MMHRIVSGIVAFIMMSMTYGTCDAQEMNVEQWQADLDYLHELVTTERSNLFHTITREEWEAQVKTLKNQIPEMQPHEIMVGLSRLVSAFRIGHTQLRIHPWSGNNHPVYGFKRFPLMMYVFSDGVYVRAAHQKYREAVGWEVIKIGDRPIREAMEALRPVIPWENEQFFISSVPAYLSCPEILHAQGVIDDLAKTTLTVERNGQQKKITLYAEPAGTFHNRYGQVQTGSNWVDANQETNNPTPLYLKDLHEISRFEYLPGHKLVYVRHSQVRNEDDETIEQFFQRVLAFVDQYEVEKLVLDVRLNGGGNNYLNRPIIVGLIGNHKINQPGRLFTIIGRRTFSAAQNLVNELEKYTETIFVGEPTAENVNFWGDTRQYQLPNSGLPLRLSWLWWQNSDPRDTRPWIAPEIAVEPSFADYRNNHDPVMEEILNYQPEGPIRNQLETLYRAEKSNEAADLARQYNSDPRRRYHNIEDDINRVGYGLLNDNLGDAAIAAFRLNTELYPNSANTFDSLAEGLWKTGDLDGAIQNYEQAIEMDEDGVGANSKRMLDRIRQEMATNSQKSASQ